MTYMFGRIHGLGGLPWHESEVTGEMVGNPSVSSIVSSYMLSLRRRKVAFLSSQSPYHHVHSLFLTERSRQVVLQQVHVQLHRYVFTYLYQMLRAFM